jgi:hypothetical protein
MTGQPPSEAERFQQRVGPYIDRLLEALEASSTMAGAAFDPHRRELVLYVVGEPTATLVDTLAEAPDGLLVQWRPALYTRDQLVAESHRIMAANGRLNTGGPRNDGSGLLFTTTDADLLATVDPQDALGSRYPVTLRHSERPCLY